VNKQKLQEYENLSDFRLMKKIPIIVSLNGRNFSKLTNKCEKPFSTDLLKSFCGTALKLSQEAEGCVFSYCYNDQIFLLLRNDFFEETEAWFDNKIQKITSCLSGIASLEFYKTSKLFKLEFQNDPIFFTHVFTLPTIDDAVSFFILKQQAAYLKAINNAVFYELSKKFSQSKVESMLDGASSEEKILLLKDYCDLEFSDYPLIYKRGFACYKMSSLNDTSNKLKWNIDLDVPIFSKNEAFLRSIFISGKDIKL